MRKKLISTILVFCMMLALMPVLKITVNASTSKTQAEAVNWAKAQIGESLDYDHTFGAQCVDLIFYYYNFLGEDVVWGNGSDFATNSLPVGWSRVPYSNGVVPQPGDIAVWTYAASSDGHVAIVLSGDANGFTAIDQNWSGQYCKEIYHNYSYGTLACFIRPDFEKLSIKPGIYTIHSARDWNKVIDISGDSTAAGANIQLFDFLDNDVQKFRVVKEGDYYCIQSVYSGMWLDVASPVNENRANVQLWNTNQNNEEKWTFEDAGNGYVYIRNYYGNYVDLAGDSTENHTNIQVYDTKESDSQRWRLVPVAEPIDVKPGVYTIHSAWDWNKVLDIKDDSTENRSRIQLYDYLGNDVQKFRVIKEGDYYYIQSVYSGLWMDVAYPVTESHSNVQLYNLNTMPEQKWQFEDAGNGYVYIRNYYGNYVDITSDSVTNNANIQVYHAKENDSQRWRLIAEPEPNEIPEGIYTIHSSWDSAKVLDIASDSMENQANIQLYDFLDNDVQKFRIIRDGEYYHIQSVYSSLWLDVAEPSTESHSNVQLYNTNTLPREKWQFEFAGDGYVNIRNYYGNYIDIQYDSVQNHSNIQAFHEKTGNSERWRLIPDTYNIWLNPGEGIASTSMLQVRYRETCNLRASYVSRGEYTLKGWNLHRIADDKWFVADVGWRTEAEIQESGLAKQLYVQNLSMQLDDSWLNQADAPVVNAFEFCAVWEDSPERVLMAVAKHPATCTEDGTEAYWQCEGCGKMFSDAQGKNEISAAVIIPATGHTWDDGVITMEPTAFSEGVKTFTCTVCGETRTESIPIPDPTNPFTDVIEGKFYYDPVLWAFYHDPVVTTGVDATHFAPDRICTRAHVVAFLWRANGCPEPQSLTSSFKDVKDTNKYYYKAVLWAAEQGITTGYSDGTFRPDDECTRGQVVTFLWRAKGEPAPTGTTNPFSDVAAGKYYTTAVLWALQNGITQGRTATTFGPDDACTRGHVVTFLYRAFA